jgi:hypothetical protein
MKEGLNKIVNVSHYMKEGLNKVVNVSHCTLHEGRLK